ncbi:MAG TPA: dephospho-CoA kinase [Candidatus Sulfotelmatobacter sp.]|nr:dephospho-CoA kinase [Candidatus Sulfotelmatobacter sp.]
MNLFGLTGGVGMGKSTAAAFFQQHGAKIVDTDLLARELVQPGQPALDEIRAVFGQNLISPDGHLRRDRLADIVFEDPFARKKLENILHPRIRRLWLAQVESWRNENCRIGIVVIPLLFETDAASHFDKVICVACSETTRRERLAARGWTPRQIQARIASQMPIADKIARAHFVIWSEGPLENHSDQVDCIQRGRFLVL